MNQRTEKVVLFTLYLTIAFQVALMMINIGNSNRNHVKTLINQTYLRASNCVAAGLPNVTPEYIEQCYDKAESATGQKIDRYGQ